MEDIENDTNLQEFTEDMSHSGNRPILTSQGKQGNVCVCVCVCVSVRERELEGEWKINVEKCGINQNNNQLI